VFSAAMLGNKVFDYLGAGKPVVYSGPDSAVSDIITSLDAGIVCPSQDAKALAQAIKLLEGNPQRVAQYSRAAGGFRKAGYTARESAMKLKDLIDSLV
jgi:glycosyltransferase involved in cell wall biosynthesis